MFCKVKFDVVKGKVVLLPRSPYTILVQEGLTAPMNIIGDNDPGLPILKANNNEGLFVVIMIGDQGHSIFAVFSGLSKEMQDIVEEVALKKDGEGILSFKELAPLYML